MKKSPPVLPVAVTRAGFLAQGLRPQFAQDFTTGSLGANAQFSEHHCRDTASFQQKAEEQVSSLDARMVQGPCFASGNLECFADPQCERTRGGFETYWRWSHQPFDLATHCLGVQVEFVENVDEGALGEPEQSQQHMFGANKLMAEPLSLVARDLQ